ncbi:MAG: hypothetical protein GQF41_4367 [Candidatus Rifleibacterium amylolyticum]|nr:MAG: hypothetical protein GQF41_4367 [Candidatus Rifleibacterium amylolyticum]
MNDSFIATAVPLCKVKLRLFINTLKVKATGKKAAMFFCAAVILMFIIGTAVSDLFSMVDAAASGPRAVLIEWIIGFIILYGIMIVFVSDLLTGHTINAGQMSSDFDYLTTLPVSPASLFCVKTFERVASDYIGVMFLLTGFLTATCRNGISLTAITLSLLLFAQISILIGTVINLTMLFLRRYLPVSSINNFFSIFGYLAGFAIFIPYMLIDQADGPVGHYLTSFIIENQELIFALKPLRWLGAILYKAGFVTEFWQFSGLWLAAMLFFGLLLYRSLDAGALAIRKTRTNKQPRKTGYFSGLAQKDYLLLQSDYNIRVNALLTPVSLILINVLITREAFELMSFNSGLNMIYAGIIYFCMFGATNAIGSEGRTIALLETLPLHPQEILKRKFTFWLAVSSVIFLPLAAGTSWYMEFELTTALRVVLMTFLFTCASVWAALQFSAIFPKFDSKMLQQSSSIWAKAGGFLLLLMLIPIKELSLLNFYSLLIFVLIVVFLNMKARVLLFYRTEESQHEGPRQEWFNFMLLMLAFIGSEVTVRQLFMAIAPTVNTGFWSWVLPLLFFLPVMLVTTISGRQSREISKDAAQLSPVWQSAAVILLSSLLLALLNWSFITRTPEFRLLLHREFVYFAELIEKTGLSFDISAFMIGAILTLFAGLTTLLATRTAGRLNDDDHHLRTISVFAILPAIAPSQLMIPATAATIVAAICYRLFKCPVSAALTIAISVAIPAILLLN